MKLLVTKAIINSIGKSHASARVSAGDVDKTSSWNFSAEDGNKLLGANGNDWATYAKWHLGEDTNAEKETKARYTYPFGKNGKVYRSALAAIKQLAAQQENVLIYGLARELSDKSDGKAALPPQVKAPPMRMRAYATLQDLKFSGRLADKLMAYDPYDDNDDDPDMDDEGDLDDQDDDTKSAAMVVEGIASTPSTDRMGDIVEPEGCQVSLPIPFLWQHNTKEPIGEVTSATFQKEGIPVRMEIPNVQESGSLRDRLLECMQSLKYGLVKGLSIGFMPIEYSYMEDTGGYRFIKWMWYELSAVTIPANIEGSISNVKSFAQRKSGVLVPRKPFKLPRKSLIQVPRGYGRTTEQKHFMQREVDRMTSASQSAIEELAGTKAR